MKVKTILYNHRTDMHIKICHNGIRKLSFLNQRKEKRKYVAGPGMEPGTTRVRYGPVLAPKLLSSKGQVHNIGLR